MTSQLPTTTSATTYLDEFMDKMYLVPNDINRYLRLIRTLDKRAETVQLSLNHMQSRFLTQLREFKQSVSTNGHSSTNGNSIKKHQKLGHQVPSHLKTQYQKILIKQKQLYGYYKQKHQISQQLKAMVSQFYQQLDGELKTKLRQKTEEQREVFYNQRRKAIVGNVTGGGKMPAMDGSKVTGQGAKGGSSSAYNSLSFTSGVTNNINSVGNKQQFTYDLKQPTYCYCLRASFGEMVMCQNPYCERQWFHLDCIDQKNLPEKWYCLECQKQKQKTRNATSRGFFVNRQSTDK